MGRNNLQKLSPVALAARARHFYNIASQNPGEFGLAGFDLQALESAAQLVESGNAAVFDAKNAYHAAIRARLKDQEDLAGRLSSAANVVYSATLGSPVSIASLGLSVRSKSNGGEWRYVESTTKTRLVLDSILPGVRTDFCVVATKNGHKAIPSGIATVYGSTAGEARRAA